jgi:hypothetical protein
LLKKKKIVENEKKLIFSLKKVEVKIYDEVLKNRKNSFFFFRPYTKNFVNKNFDFLKMFQRYYKSRPIFINHYPLSYILYRKNYYKKFFKKHWKKKKKRDIFFKSVQKGSLKLYLKNRFLSLKKNVNKYYFLNLLFKNNWIFFFREDNIFFKDLKILEDFFVLIFLFFYIFLSLLLI